MEAGMAGVMEKPISSEVTIDDETDGAETKPKKRKEKEKKEKANKKRGSAAPVILALIVVLAAVLVAVVGFNVFNVRDRYLTDTLKKIPFVNRLLPEEETITAIAGPELPSVDELQERIAELEEFVDALEESEQTLLRRVELHVEEILRLQAVEDNQLQFKADKAEFDRMIAMNDPAAYARFYASIAPENAEELGPQAIAAANRAKDLSAFLKTIGAMEERSAAMMLTEMIRSDLDLVVSIISNLPADFGGAILNEMEARDAATVTKRWSPAGF